MSVGTVAYEAAGADVLAAGAVLWRPAGASVDGPVDVAMDLTADVAVEVAVVHRPRYDDWAFAKGKSAGDEPLAAAAVREVAEETGFTARLGHALADVRYAVPEGRKLVRYWAARAVGGAFVANDETDELRWLAPDAAAELLSYPHDVELLRRFSAIGVPAALVLLVRHAKAGSRHQWDGEDDLRPLSGAGRAQAARLAELLGLFGPDRIVTAPPVRCRDTIAPLAARLGLPVTEEPLLGEDGYWMDPPAGLARLRELARPGVTVVCSQGGVIPDVVGELAAVGGPHAFHDVDPDDVPSKKGSTWVLGLDGGELRTADYLPRAAG